MTFEETIKLYEQLSSSKSSELVESLKKAAIRYARIRTDWHMASSEERLAMDRNRKIAHDSFIDSCNILSRNMVKTGEDVDWRIRLGDDRKKLGDFACYLHCHLGILAR